MNKYMKGLLLGGVMSAGFGMAPLASAADYIMDVKGAHTFVQFRVKHLGYSWLYGRFDRFDGKFSYTPGDDTKNSASMSVDVTSLNSNHAERDVHLAAPKFLNSGKFPKATFVSRSFKTLSDSKAELSGELTLLGVSKTVTFEVDILGGGKDPWGGERQGFEATTTINSADFGLQASKMVGEVEIIVSVEGIKKG